jgi:5-methylcytosine-specific restriction endonuclease McrA
MKQEILKLTKGFFPCGVSSWKTAMIDIISGAAHPIDISYEIDEDGNINKNKIEYMEVVRDFENWRKLPVRPYDESVKTSKEEFRLPAIIVCASFNKIIFKRVVFPTKSNIWQRDNWTCCYTGEKLDRDTVSVDHIIPSSRGGQNTWENLVTAKKSLNIWKGDRTPRECGLKLLRKPVKPKNGMIFNFMRDEWKMFLDGGTHE